MRSFPKQPEEGALQAGEVVDDGAAAPAIGNVVGIEGTSMLLDQDLDRGVFEGEHAGEIVDLGRARGKVSCDQDR